MFGQEAEVADRHGCRVAAVVLNWNGWVDTLACLDSLERLTSPCRVLVVDNGSTDGSVQKIRSARPDAELHVLDRNLGFGRGVNEGIRAVVAAGWRPEFIWVLNNDTTPASDSLARMLATADADPRIGVVGSVLVDSDGSDRVQAWGGGDVNPWLGTTTSFSSSHGQDPQHLIGASMLVRSAVLNAIGGFDERYFFYLEDTDFSCRVREAGWRLAVADGAVVRHRRGASVDAGDQSRSMRSDMHYARSSAIFLASRAPRAVLPFALIVRLGAIVGRRGLRRQVGRVPAMVAAFAGGIRAGLRRPEIPTFQVTQAASRSLTTNAPEETLKP